MSYDLKVLFKENVILTNLSHLVKGDYNSITLKFDFDIKEFKKALFKVKKPNNTEYIDEIKGNQLILGDGVLNQAGTYEYEVSIYGVDDRLTNYALKKFVVRDGLGQDSAIIPESSKSRLDEVLSGLNIDLYEYEKSKFDKLLNSNEHSETINIEDCKLGLKYENGKPLYDLHLKSKKTTYKEDDLSFKIIIEKQEEVEGQSQTTETKEITIPICLIGDNEKQDEIFNENGKWYVIHNFDYLFYHNQELPTEYKVDGGSLKEGHFVYWKKEQPLKEELSQEIINILENINLKAGTYLIRTTGTIEGSYKLDYTSSLNEIFMMLEMLYEMVEQNTQDIATLKGGN